MGKTIYKGQPYTLLIDTKTDLDDAHAVEIEYKTPSGIEDVWDDCDVAGMIVSRDIDGDENSEAGLWTFRVRVKFEDGQNWTPGVPDNVSVADYNPIT